MSTFSGTIHTTVPRYGFWMPGCQLWAYNEQSESFPNLNLPPHLLPLSPTLTPSSPPLCGCCSEPEPDPAPPSVLTLYPHSFIFGLAPHLDAHLGADASVPPGPHHHQLIRLPGRGGRGEEATQSCCPDPSISSRVFSLPTSPSPRRRHGQPLI